MDKNSIDKAKTKTKFEKVVELYNNGITDYKELAIKSGASYSTIDCYISKAKKLGLIEKPKTKYEKIVELYKSGITNYKEIAIKTNTSYKSVSYYISKAKNLGIIEKNETKPKTKFEKVVELYNNGITDYKELAIKSGASYQTIPSYITKARKLGLIEKKEKTKTKFEEVVELYKSGITNYKELATKLDTSRETIRSYIVKAKKLGLIEKPKTKFEKIVELYRSGITDYKELATRVDTSYDTVGIYIFQAKKQGLIEKKEKPKTKFERVIELYKSGITNYNELATRVGIRNNTARDYISKAKNIGLIEKKEKTKTKFEEIVELYRSGITDYNEIATRVDSTYNTVAIYLSKAKNLGLIDNSKTKFEEILELYRSGVTDYNEIATRVDSTYSTVAIYLSKAEKQGLIEKKEKPKTKYDEVVELYKSGITDYNELATRVNTSYNTVHFFISKAKKQGLIEKKKTKFEEVIELYKSGITTYNELAEKVDASSSTISGYLYKARQLGLIEKNETVGKSEKTQKIRESDKEKRKNKKEKNKNKDKVTKINTVNSKEHKSNVEKREKNVSHIPKKIEKGKEKIKDRNASKQEKTMELLERLYPRDVAKRLNVPSYKIYDIFEKLSREEKKQLLLKRLYSNPLFKEVNTLRKEKNIKLSVAMDELAEKITPDKSAYLARMYYFLGDSKKALELLEKMSNNKYLGTSIRNQLINEKNNIMGDIISRQLRKAYREDNSEMKTKFLYLCRKYQVSPEFIGDITNDEEEKEIKEEPEEIVL